jgi:hypothetical protein
LVGCEIGLCAFVRPRVPCVPCVSRLPPVSFYRYRYRPNLTTHLPASPPLARRSTLPLGPRRGFEWTAPLVALQRSKSLRRRAPRPAAGPPTRAIASARARALTMATVRPPKHPQLQRLLFTEMEEQPRAARRAEDEARVLFL